MCVWGGACSRRAYLFVQAAHLAARAAAVSAATGVGGSVVIPPRRPPFSKDLDGDGLIKLLVSTVDKRVPWMQRAWATAGDEHALFAEVSTRTDNASH